MIEEKKIILFDIDYTLSNRKFLKEFGRKYLANLVGKTVPEIDPIVDELINESLRKFQIFKIDFYAKSVALKFNDESIERAIINMFKNLYPYDNAIYDDVKPCLSKLSDKFILGIQSDGEDEFQRRKIKSLINFFNKDYIYIFQNKKAEIFNKIKELESRIIIIDDRADYIDLLSKQKINAFLLKRGPYAMLYQQNPGNYLHISKSVENLADFSNKILNE